MSEEIIKLCGIVLIIAFIIYLVTSWLNIQMNVVEGLTNPTSVTSNTTSGIGASAANYSTSLQNIVTKLHSDVLLLNNAEYKKEYENIILNMDDYIDGLMLKTVLSININSENVSDNIEKFKNLNDLSNKDNNRKGILLSNKDTEQLGINTITPVLWALYNELPPKITQKPHKHNSVALDLCVKCSDSENIYTLIGNELDENGNILNPKKVYWKEGSMFITPPGLWHSHNNDGDTCAYILPIQDAGLLLYQRILGIVLYR